MVPQERVFIDSCVKIALYHNATVVLEYRRVFRNGQSSLCRGFQCCRFTSKE